jgi:L-methionine (R)-S-oxide reductase
MTKEDRYEAALREIDVRLAKGGDLVADLGNAAAVLKKRLEDHASWIGFYFVRGDKLVLGPFQGRPACVFLPFGKGVCGTCAAMRETINVADVHAFEGHIACDPDSRSELVVPVFDGNGAVRAVLDMDSDRPAAFDAIDIRYAERLAARLANLW